ncbi:ribonuclease P protein component [Patescibacteria group bacterium]|nr:ribonuclease P protein component [Patescibacteria group bacterium]
MLSKEKRIRDTKDFKRVYQKGTFFYHRFFNLSYLKNRGSLTRLGFVIGKKVSNKAVVRNSLKRKFREASRKLYEQAPKGYDVVINIKKEALGVKQSELEPEIQRALQRIGKNEKGNSNTN